MTSDATSRTLADGATPPTTSTTIHLVPHTHWDREWYQPFQTFRMRLVDLIDVLLERMASDDRLRFTLDGQAATIDDYLEVRPGAEPLIRRLIAEERLAIGPWQILLDEFLVSGETIVRDLELGWARSEELGRAMPVGYLPDMFGHIAQMPQILRRAGIGQAVVWRGVPSAVTHNVFAWSAPDGSTVETEYLIGGYGNGAYLFDVPDRLGPKLREHRAANAQAYGTTSQLAMYGTDHAVPSARLADLVDAVNAAGSDIVVRMETLADYLATRPAPEHPEHWTGELRSGARANMLMNVASARVDLKAAAGRAERILERYAEPLTALHGGPWPTRLLELAWRRMVENSAHDSICGCSHDAVVGQVLVRFAEAEQIGRGIVERTVARIAGHVPPPAFAVVNPSPVDHADQVELRVARPAAWSSIGLRVGGRMVPTQEITSMDVTLRRDTVRAADIPEFFRRRRHGRELFGRSINGLTIEPPEAVGGPRRIVVLVHDVPEPPELDVEELLATIDVAIAEDTEARWEIVTRSPDVRVVIGRVPVPALAWASVEPVDGGPAELAPLDHPVRVDERRLDNGLVSLAVSEDGTVTIAGGGTTLNGVGRIVDGGDFGDSYNYGPPAGDELVDRPGSVRVMVLERGPLRASLDVVRTYEWPLGVRPDGSGRTAERVPTTTSTRYELRADEPFVRVGIAFENRSRDHRVRFHVPLPSPVDGSSAEGQFAVVERGLEVEGGHGEVPLPTFPAHGWVSTPGVSVLLDQLTEYEVVDGCELAITLLRSFGLISRNANPYREDPAGPEVPVPNGQLLGERTFSFAILPHEGPWTAGGTVAAAEAYRTPFLAARGTGGTTPTIATDVPARGLRIDGDGIVLSACRRHGEWLELRLVNESSGQAQALVHTSVSDAREADLLGRPGASIPVGPGQPLLLELGPWEIRTVHVREMS
jgi:mannosylglycerate hydrolase